MPSKIYNSEGNIIFQGSDSEAKKIWAKMLSEAKIKWYAPVRKYKPSKQSKVTGQTFEDFVFETRKKPKLCPDCATEDIEKKISPRATRCSKHAAIYRRIKEKTK